MNELAQDQRLDTVLGVKVQLSARLGTCQLMMRDVLELAPGVIIQLDQRANDLVGLYINDKLIALSSALKTCLSNSPRTLLFPTSLPTRPASSDNSSIKEKRSSCSRWFGRNRTSPSPPRLS